MKTLFKTLLPLILVLCLSTSCGGSSSDSDDISNLTYSETVSALTTEGLTTYTKGKSLGDSHSAMVGNAPTSEDAEDSQVKLTSFIDDFETYTNHLATIETYSDATFNPTSSSLNNSPSSSLFKYSVGSIGIDAGSSLQEVHETLSTKKAECDELYDAIPGPTDSGYSVANFDAAKALYDTCYSELVSMAGEAGLELVVVQGGGSVTGGATAGAVFLYVAGAGATLVSAPGILAVVVGGVIGSKVASAIYSFCTSSSDAELRTKFVSTGNYCAAASAQGTTDSPMAMNITGGTGTLEIFVEGYAPIVVENVTITSGHTTTINVTPVALDDVTDESSDDINNASDNATTTDEESEAESCDDIVSIAATNSPSDPGPYENVSVTATVVPAISGCSITYSIVGTDDYAASGTPTTDSSGQISFTIPGGASDVFDVVEVTESSSGVSTTLTYIF
ncbi:MAG: hypothetical protein ABII18_13765 [bacterium]|nr:hypothetical protein [bacterium]MBU1918719.1 hypothetical protein [bacterium]